jgi:hypothetical protein
MPAKRNPVASATNVNQGVAIETAVPGEAVGFGFACAAAAKRRLLLLGEIPGPNSAVKATAISVVDTLYGRAVKWEYCVVYQGRRGPDVTPGR